jgi:multiple sugar transport system ATP-binding protein
VREPSILLMDEPISHLEARQRARMREELVKLQADLGITTVYVTHDQVEAMTMADRIAVMDLGKLQQVGTPKEVYERPRTEFVGGFIGEPPMNVADCELTRVNGQISVQSPSLKVALPARMADRLADYDGPAQVRLGIRPESILASMSPVEDGVKATVHHLEPQGERTILGAQLAGEEIFLVEVAPEFEAELDEALYLQFREPLHIFSTADGMNLTY